VRTLPELTTVTFADQFSDNITYYKCDVTKLEEVEAVAKKVIEEVCHNTPFDAHHIDRILQIGHPTVLVNNAGVVQGKLILDLSPEDIRQSVSLLIATLRNHLTCAPEPLMSTLLLTSGL
jgi:NAD(P)-dependent dehydrogenase (short-subunit alcohol dehydrogenase family)